MGQIAFYCKKEWIPDGVEPLEIVTPFFGDSGKVHESWIQHYSRFKQDYRLIAHELFRITDDASQADYALWPCDLTVSFSSTPEHLEKLAEFLQCDLPLVLFDNNDYPPGHWRQRIRETFGTQRDFFLGCVVHERSKATPGDFVLPIFIWDDLADLGLKRPPLRALRPEPTIGFAGSAEKHPRLHTRRLAIAHLIAAQQVHVDMILLPTGSARPMTREAFAKIRVPFVENAIRTDYQLIVRGFGNFATRFYEALALGRIPVVVDSDFVLPFAEHIPWEKLVPIVDAKDLSKIPDVIMAFHKGFSAEEFLRRQALMRQIFIEWLSCAGYYRNLWRLLRL